MVVLIITKDLAEVVNYDFINRIIPKSLKEFIIMVLCKKKKKKISLLGSYKLIIFKNTLAKVLKKYIVNIMSKAAEKYRLLLWN